MTTPPAAPWSDRPCACGSWFQVERRRGHNGLHLIHGDTVAYFEDMPTYAENSGLTDEMVPFLERLHAGQ